MVVDIIERTPVKPHAWRGEEHAFRVRQRESIDCHRAVDRPVDPPHPDLHSIRELEPFNPLGDEAAARIGVDPDHHKACQQEQPDHHADNHLEDRQRPVATKPEDDRLVALLGERAGRDGDVAH
jgi:hypothetical protein